MQYKQTKRVDVISAKLFVHHDHKQLHHSLVISFIHYALMFMTRVELYSLQSEVTLIF